MVFCNTYEPEIFKPYQGLSAQEARKRLGLVVPATLLVYTGNTLTYDFSALFEAISLIDGVVLVLVGVTNKEKMQALAREKGVEDKVILVPRVDRHKVPLYLIAGDILVVPYVSSEPGAFPVKIFEYLAAAKPIISFSSDCIKEALKHRRNAMLIDPPTAENWQKAIVEIIQNPRLAEYLSFEAKKDSLLYTWERRGREIFSFLKKIYEK